MNYTPFVAKDNTSGELALVLAPNLEDAKRQMRDHQEAMERGKDATLTIKDAVNDVYSVVMYDHPDFNADTTLEELDKWLAEQKKYRESGRMQSMAESAWGGVIIDEVIAKIKELKGLDDA